MKLINCWLTLVCLILHRRKHAAKVADWEIVLDGERVCGTSHLCLKCRRMWKEYR